MQNLMMKPQQDKLMRYLPTLQKRNEIARKQFIDWLNTARPKQITPKGEWNTWLILAGRGWGKTRTGAQDVVHYATTNANVRCAVVAPTFGDLRRVCFEGDSGILSILPEECYYKGTRSKGYNKSSVEINLDNGSVIQGYAASGICVVHFLLSLFSTSPIFTFRIL